MDHLKYYWFALPRGRLEEVIIINVFGTGSDDWAGVGTINARSKYRIVSLTPYDAAVAPWASITESM